MSADEDSEETKYERSESVFSFTVSKSKWWNAFYQPDKKNLKGGWADKLKAKFKQHKPQGVFCSLAAEGNSVVHPKAKGKSGYPFSGRMHCTSTVCTMRWFLMIEDFDELNSNSSKVHIHVYGEGIHNHTKSNPVRASIKGKQRKEFKDRVEAKGAASTKRDLLLEKLNNEKGAAELNAGNYDDVPTVEALRQMLKERKGEDDLHRNPWINLKLRTMAVNLEHGQNSVFTLSDTPFQMAWATDSMLEYLHTVHKSTEVVIGNFDSTGSLLSPVEWDPKKKMILLYSLVVKLPKLAPISVCEYVSNDHHEHEISLLFPRLLSRYQSFVSTKFGSKPTRLPFSIFLIDMSRAMTNAAMEALVGMSLISYLYACMKAKAEGILIFIVIAWCYAHFLHAISRKVVNYVPLKSKQFSPARKCLKFTMAEIAKTDTVEDAVSIFKLSVVVFNSKYMTDEVVLSLEALATRFSTTVEELKDVEAAHRYLEDKSENPDLPIFIPDEDRACSSLWQTYKDSPFYQIFKEASDSVEYGEALEPSTPNPFYIPEIIKYLLRYLLPFYPLWSRYMQCMLLPLEENPLTNSAVELKYKIDKHVNWQRKKYHKPARFLHKTVEDTEKLISEFKYPTGPIRKNRKRKRETSNVPEESQLPSKKVCVEKWKKRSSKRPLHGHHSKANTALYGKILREKARKIMDGIKKNLLRDQASKDTSGDSGDCGDREDCGDSGDLPHNKDSSEQQPIKPKRRSSSMLISPFIVSPWLVNNHTSDEVLFLEDFHQRHTLAPKEFIDALCIDAFGSMLVQKTVDSGLYFSYISPIIMKEKIDSIGSWALKHDLILSDVWMIPIHSTIRSHWTLLIVNIKDRKFICIDSLGVPSTDDPDLSATIGKIMGIFTFLAKKCVFARVNWSNWKLHLCIDIPTQPNGYDCGAIICVYMSAICGLSSGQYQEQHSNQIRRWIAASTLTSETRDLQIDNPSDIKGLSSGDLTQLSAVYAPPGSSTWYYITGLKNQYNATSSNCAIGSNCMSMDEMVYCAAPKCRDWYHLVCIKEKKKKVPSIYKCVTCSQPHIQNIF